MIVAVILAAGQGRRLGGPKALLAVRAGGAGGGDEMPLIEAQCRDRLGAESERVVAVLREDSAAVVGDRLRAIGAEVVVSHAADEVGPAGSLAAAAAHLGDDGALRAVLVTPVDVRAGAVAVRALVDVLVGPAGALDRSSIDCAAASHATAVSSIDLAAASRAAAASLPIAAAIPRFQGRKGHPVALHPALLARYREPDPPPLRDHLRGFGERVVIVDVDDPHVAEDLDFAHQTDMLRRITGGAGAARFFGGR